MWLSKAHLAYARALPSASRRFPTLLSSPGGESPTLQALSARALCRLSFPAPSTSIRLPRRALKLNDVFSWSPLSMQAYHNERCTPPPTVRLHTAIDRSKFNAVAVSPEG